MVYKKLLTSGIIAVIVLLFSIFLIWLIMPKIVSVQDIRENPAIVKGNIAVIGKVVIEDDNSAFFLLSDLGISCKEIPIVYKSQRPKAYSEIIAYGQFRKVDRTLNADILWWEYFLEADKIKTREDIFSGYWSYTMQQWVHKSTAWFYEKCNICRKIKDRLISFWFYKKCNICRKIKDRLISFFILQDEK